CITPERFNTVDMSFPIRKLILTMMHPKVLVKTNVDQSIVATPAIGVNHRAALHMATDSMRPEVRLIDVYRALQGRFKLAGLGDMTTHVQVNTANRSHRMSGQFARAHGFDIQGKTPYQPPEFSFADFLTTVIPICTNHSRKFSDRNLCFPN